ncbi:50S ribosomal protein L18Ae [Methanothermococcus okinawensis]|uniref:Large ribosomal subunit protein eL20 n=1 Tax=Methanothermococcus okinawensis (strain DSM 14208 / JCM 11175 / IH1) TaxID=647113 RepID=F8AMW1_METOI|nr:50S ribosomal protein L18Ae [Methanothermococcus okinawensis]AEH06084.1 50S ribosomal protein LX [Methanothermococcus okinawensis IH1]
MAKIFKITGRILGKDEPMVFTKECRALKEEDALEYIYSDIGSKHNVKRTLIKIEEIKEISEDEVTDPILQKIVAM